MMPDTVLGTFGQFTNTFSYSTVDGTSKIGMVIINLISLGTFTIDYDRSNIFCFIIKSLFLILLTFLLVIGCYLWTVVLSYYQEVKKEVTNTKSTSAGRNNSKPSV